MRDQVNGMTYHDIAAPAGDEGRVEEGRKTGKEEESAKLGLTWHDTVVPAGEEPRAGGDQGMP